MVERIKFGLTFDWSPKAIEHAEVIPVFQRDNQLSFQNFENPLRHTLILGDNFAALSNLMITNKAKIDVIYIDPPYNTGGNDLGYLDKRPKDVWLSDIKTKLQLVQELLNDHGVIFVSVDDNMQAYLKVLMDEIFGEENFICNFIWDKRNAQNDAKFVESNHEYILFYAKHISNIKLKKEKNNDFVSGQLFSLLLGNTAGGLLNNRPKLGHTIYWHPDTNDFQFVFDYDIDLAKTSNDPNIYYDDSKLIASGYLPIRPKQYNGMLGCWKWSAEKMQQEVDRLVVQKNSSGYTVKYRDTREEFFKNNKSIFSDVSSGLGTKNINQLKLSFSNVKPVQIIKKLLKMLDRPAATILDFYAGSGTTGEAVLELNREDGGNRKFILCTLPTDNGNNIGTEICYERLFRINHGFGTNGEQIPEWLKKHEPYHNNLTVYQIINHDVSLNTETPFQNFDFSPYTDLNPFLNFQDNEHILQNLYLLTVSTWRKGNNDD